MAGCNSPWRIKTEPDKLRIEVINTSATSMNCMILLLRVSMPLMVKISLQMVQVLKPTEFFVQDLLFH